MSDRTRKPAAAGAACTVLLAVVLGAAPALAEDYPRILRVDASHSPEISVTAVLPPSLAGRALPASAFRVTEDGTPRTASRAVALSSSSLRLVLVVDRAVRPELLVVQQGAVRELVIGLPAGAEVGLVAAGTQPTLLAPPSTDRGATIGALIDLDPSSDAPADHVTAALDLALHQLQPARPGDAVVAVDGLPTASHVASALSQRATSSGTAVYSLTFRAIPDGYLDGLPAATGGRAVHVTAANRLVSAYDAVLDELAGRYRIDFTSAAPDRHAVELTVETAGFRGTTTFFVDSPPAARKAPASAVRGRHLGITLPALVTVVALSSFVLRRRASRAY